MTRDAMVIGDWIQREVDGRRAFAATLWALIGTSTRAEREVDGRWAFAATPLTAGPVYDEWVGPSGRIVDFLKGNQNPIAYWPPR